MKEETLIKLIIEKFNFQPLVHFAKANWGKCTIYTTVESYVWVDEDVLTIANTTEELNFKIENEMCFHVCLKHLGEDFLETL